MVRLEGVAASQGDIFLVLEYCEHDLSKLVRVYVWCECHGCAVRGRQF